MPDTALSRAEEPADDAVAPVRVLAPTATPVPLVLDSPHSGTWLPPGFAPGIDPHFLRMAEDSHVDKLLVSAPSLGATVVCAQWSRNYIDVNRAEDDLDVAMLPSDWDDHVRPSGKTQRGIGLIRRYGRPGQELYANGLDSDELRDRIAAGHAPYHAALSQAISECQAAFGFVVHINCHSMPSPPMAALDIEGLGLAADIVLGTRDGTSADEDVVATIEGTLQGLGYRVARNDPYRGQEIVTRYGHPEAGVHSVQLEIARALYMNEFTRACHEGFEPLLRDLDELFATLADYATSRARSGF